MKIVCVTESHTANGGKKLDSGDLWSLESCLLQLQLRRLFVYMQRSVHLRPIAAPAIPTLFEESDAERGWRILSKSAEMLSESLCLVGTGQNQTFQHGSWRRIALLLLQLQQLLIGKNTGISCEPWRLHSRTWLHAARSFRLHGPRGRTQVGE